MARIVARGRSEHAGRARGVQRWCRVEDVSESEPRRADRRESQRLRREDGVGERRREVRDAGALCGASTVRRHQRFRDRYQSSDCSELSVHHRRTWHADGEGCANRRTAGQSERRRRIPSAAPQHGARRDTARAGLSGAAEIASTAEPQGAGAAGTGARRARLQSAVVSEWQHLYHSDRAPRLHWQQHSGVRRQPVADGERIHRCGVRWIRQANGPGSVPDRCGDVGYDV